MMKQGLEAQTETCQNDHGTVKRQGLSAPNRKADFLRASLGISDFALPCLASFR